MPVRPVTPKQAKDRKQESLPDEIIEVFNELIIENLHEGVSTFRAEEVGSLFRKKTGKAPQSRWLNIESIYRKAGWEVEYDGPGYNESYPTTFTFRAR